MTHVAWRLARPIQTDTWTAKLGTAKQDIARPGHRQKWHRQTPPTRHCIARGGAVRILVSRSGRETFPRDLYPLLDSLEPVVTGL